MRKIHIQREMKDNKAEIMNTKYGKFRNDQKIKSKDPLGYLRYQSK